MEGTHRLDGSMSIRACRRLEDAFAQMERSDSETLCLRRQEGMKRLRKHKGGTEEAKTARESERKEPGKDTRLWADEETKETEKKSGFLRGLRQGGGGEAYIWGRTRRVREIRVCTSYPGFFSFFLEHLAG